MTPTHDDGLELNNYLLDDIQTGNSDLSAPEWVPTAYRWCPTCGGKGWVGAGACLTCGGAGKVGLL